VALDFPRAWELARAAPAAAHHPECSYAQTNGALLCDLGCPVIADSPEFRCLAFHGAGGQIISESGPQYGKCAGCECAPRT